MIKPLKGINPEKLFLYILLSAFFIQILFSLSWKLIHDTPLLQYVSFLILEDNRIPYRDIFEYNFPGTYLFHIAWIRIFGYSDLGFRILDILWLTGILACVYNLLKRFDRDAAWFGVALMGLSYISFTPISSLQREWIIALPLIYSVLLVSHPYSHLRLRLFAVGILSACCFLVKPHAVLAFPFLVIFAVKNGSDADRRNSLISRNLNMTLDIIVSFIGFIIPVLAVYIWLVKINSYSNFIEILTNYIPLYSQLSAGHDVGTVYERFRDFVLNSLRMGSNGAWLIAILGGFYYLISRVKLDTSEKRFIVLFSMMCGVFWVYPIFAGKFWAYHWVLLQLFLIILYSFVIFHKKRSFDKFQIYFRIIITTTALLIGPRPPVSPDFIYQITHWQTRPVKNGRVSEIESFLKERLKPGDTVQPLDWTGGAVHGMLRAKARLATSFIYDTQFYHHVDNPYIIKLRERFMRELMASKPQFIIEVIAPDKPFVTGLGTSRDFLELRNYISQNYIISVEKNGYIIYTLNNGEDTNLNSEKI
ncbi:hypothetical protein K9N50_05505 [bacterium]|nr:hypothetical protein [bacterium]